MQTVWINLAMVGVSATVHAGIPTPWAVLLHRLEDQLIEFNYHTRSRLKSYKVNHHGYKSKRMLLWGEHPLQTLFEVSLMLYWENNAYMY